jgi:hypothetical protein
MKLKATQPFFLSVFIIALASALWIWFGLSFIGIKGLVGSWSVAHGSLFYQALFYLVSLPLCAWAIHKRWIPGLLLLSLILLSWLTFVWQHWSKFFYPPPMASLPKYYAMFPNWYLIPPSAERYVPDGYHVVLHGLIIGCLLLCGLAILMQIVRLFRK